MAILKPISDGILISFIKGLIKIYQVPWLSYGNFEPGKILSVPFFYSENTPCLLFFPEKKTYLPPEKVTFLPRQIIVSCYKKSPLLSIKRR